MKMKALMGKIKEFKFILMVAAVGLLVLYLFLIVNKKYNKNLFGINQEIKRLIELKLSPDDLISLNNRTSTSTQWINVKLIETDRKSYRVKIRPLFDSVVDFQLNIAETIYNLYKLNNERKPVYDVFKRADAWQLQRSSPLVVQLKFNAVPIGIYLMEETIYEQVRDNNGNYFVRLSTDTHRLRKMRYEVKNGYTRTLKKFFDKKKLAAYFVFFSLFNSDSLLPFDHMVFRFDEKKEKYQPYLTMESILSGLKEQGKIFQNPPKHNKDFFEQLNKNNLESLIRKSRHTPYARIIDIVLADTQKEIQTSTSKWND
jgi:hypothetical protein